MKKILFSIFLILGCYFLAQNNKTFMVEVPFERTPLYKENQILFSADACRDSYFRINLSEFDISVDKNFIKKYRPIALIKVETLDKKYYKILGNESIGYDDKNHSIRTIKNSLLVDYTPYSGDDIIITIALYKQKTRDKIDDTFTLLRDLSTIAPIVSSTHLDISKKIYDRIDNFFTNTEPLLSYQDTFRPYTSVNNSNTFKEGYFLFSNENIEPSSLYVEKGELKFFNEGIPKINYVLLNFEHEIELPNYLRKPYGLSFTKAKNLAQLKDSSGAINIFEREVLPQIYADANLTSYNKLVLQRRFYAEIINVISSYNSDFTAEKYPKIQCVQLNPTLNSPIIGERTYEQTQKNINRENINDLYRAVILDKKINSKIQQGQILPSQVVDERLLY